MSGLDVDTRSDVYSLGVLLYELLTGTTPLESERFRAAGYAQLQRLIQEADDAGVEAWKLEMIRGQKALYSGTPQDANEVNALAESLATRLQQRWPQYATGAYATACYCLADQDFDGAREAYHHAAQIIHDPIFIAGEAMTIYQSGTTDHIVELTKNLHSVRDRARVALTLTDTDEGRPMIREIRTEILDNPKDSLDLRSLAAHSRLCNGRSKFRYRGFSISSRPMVYESASWSSEHQADPNQLLSGSNTNRGTLGQTVVAAAGSHCYLQDC